MSTQKYTNVSGVPLSMAVFLATDNYDHDPETISATALLKPVRQIVLGGRVPTADAAADLVGMTASRMGSAIHDSIESAWVNHYQRAMLALGYPQKVIDLVKVNPKEDELTEDCIPIYLEQRSKKQVGKYIISGKFDFVGDGRVEDFKSTSVYTAIHGSNDNKYIQQGSIYRWLNPKIVTKGEMAIQFIFTDWSGARAKTEANYPPSRIQQRILPLMSVAETERFVIHKLTLIDRHMDSPEDEIPFCTDEELWRSQPVFKYYKKGVVTARSTKNFDTLVEANTRRAEDGSAGLVVERPGQVTACKYCSAFSICSQKDELIAAGDLIL
jgi:hypothetical protein